MKLILIKDFKVLPLNNTTAEVVVVGTNDENWNSTIEDEDILYQYNNGDSLDREEAKILIIKQILENNNVEYDRFDFE